MSTVQMWALTVCGSKADISDPWVQCVRHRQCIPGHIPATLSSRYDDTSTPPQWPVVCCKQTERCCMKQQVKQMQQQRGRLAGDANVPHVPLSRDGATDVASSSSHSSSSNSNSSTGGTSTSKRNTAGLTASSSSDSTMRA
jgi:hypothetical protein